MTRFSFDPRRTLHAMIIGSLLTLIIELTILAVYLLFSA